MRSNYLSLWLLLTAALAIVLWVAASDDIVVGGWTVKKAPVAELLHDKEEDSLDLYAMMPVDSLSDAVTSLKVDSTSQTLLIFGDSMTLNLAYRLAKYAKQNNHQVYSINWDSSNTKIWADSDTLDYFLRQYHPTFVFVCLGSNEMYYKNADSRIPYIKKIVEKIDTIPFLWIGPPCPKDNPAISQVLARVLGDSRFFASDGIPLERKKDKIHPTYGAAALWMDSIMRWLPNSSHPFLADVPADTIGKSNPHVTFLKPMHK